MLFNCVYVVDVYYIMSCQIIQCRNEWRKRKMLLMCCCSLLLWSFDKFDRDKILSIVHRAIPLVLFLKLLIEVCLASLKKNYSSLASDAAQAIFTIRPASLSATTGSTVLYVINRFDLLNESNESINQIVIRLIRFVMRIRFDSLHSSNDGYVLITHKQKRSSPTTTVLRTLFF